MCTGWEKPHLRTKLIWLHVRITEALKNTCTWAFPPVIQSYLVRTWTSIFFLKGLPGDFNVQLGLKATDLEFSFKSLWYKRWWNLRPYFQKKSDQIKGGNQNHCSSRVALCRIPGDMLWSMILTKEREREFRKSGWWDGCKNLKYLSWRADLGKLQPICIANTQKRHVT